jgi:AraC family transcriptional regulator of adaptative response / DNA-3-methyladenine glycosylase II
MGLRAILGQRVTVKAATTIAGRLVGAFANLLSRHTRVKLSTPSPENHGASVDDLAKHGI